MATARELRLADEMRREANRRLPKGVEAEILAILHNPWTGRTETYLKLIKTDEEAHDHTDEDSPDQ